MTRVPALFLAALLLAAPASAVNWWSAPGNTGSKLNTLSPGLGIGPGVAPPNTGYYEFTSLVDAPALDVSLCRDIDIALFPSTTDTSTGAQGYVYKCSTYTGVVGTDCNKVLPTLSGTVTDTPLTGDPTATLMGFQNLQAEDVLFHPTATTSGKTARVVVTCH